MSTEPQAATSLPAGPHPTHTHPTSLAARETPLPRFVVWGVILVSALVPIILFASVVAVMVAGNYNLLAWME